MTNILEERVKDCMLRLFLRKWGDPHESAVFIRIHQDWYVTLTTAVGKFANGCDPVPANLPELCPLLVSLKNKLHKHRFNALQKLPEEQFLNNLKEYFLLFGLKGVYSGSRHSTFLRISIQSGRRILGGIVIIPDPKDRG